MFTAKWQTLSGSNPADFAFSREFIFASISPELRFFSNLESNNHQPVRSFHHIPVLADEVAELLAPQPGELFVDGTLGGGGHAELFLKAGAHVIGLDQDQNALQHSRERLSRYGDAFQAVHANFRDLDRVLDDLSITKIDGLFLDIGVSSHQLDTAERGFSFQADGPLDMRMDQTAPSTAADLVNTADVEDLIRIFRQYGEEPSAVRIAKHLVEARIANPILTTAQLASAVESILPRRGKRHPATQIFQALRIAVNDELGALETALNIAHTRIKKGGRFGVISFHSLEDRIVKQHFRALSQPTIDRPEWPAPRPNPEQVYRLLRRKSITASARELSENPRARSAKLRVVEKI